MAAKIVTTIRIAAKNDIPQIVEFIKPFVDEGKLLPRTFDELDELIDNFFIAEQEGQMVGCAALEIYSWKLAEVRSLCVAKSVQGMGVGKLLVNACVQRAKDKHILEVMAVTSADGFFMSCGFDYTLPGEKKALFYQTRDEE
jgi:N-acetylglutamate synthase-like GNAT family acetyltransferase